MTEADWLARQYLIKTRITDTGIKCTFGEHVAKYGSSQDSYRLWMELTTGHPRMLEAFAVKKNWEQYPLVRGSVP